MDPKSIYYFDHAATSWPKPPEVIQAVTDAITEYGANPGRGSHQMAVRASRVLFETRNHLAQLFGIRNSNDIHFTLNTTHALNLAIKGFLQPGDHVICTDIEHNSVRRPLEYLKKAINIKVTYMKTGQNGQLDLEEMESLIREQTTLLVCNHSSNLLGSILPVREIGKIAKKHGVRTLIDGAQSAGSLPIDVGADGIDMLAFPGHKGLLGPQGTGGLYIAPDIELHPIFHGGTGSQSEKIEQPSVRPDRYESGTQNTPGIAGLNAGVQYVLNHGLEKIHARVFLLTQRFMKGLREIEGVQILGPEEGEDRTGIVSFIIPQIDPSALAHKLDRNYQIAVRAGYHCTPLAHEMAGTLATGAVRASFGCFTKESEVDYFLNALYEMFSSDL